MKYLSIFRTSRILHSCKNREVITVITKVYFLNILIAWIDSTPMDVEKYDRVCALLRED